MIAIAALLALLLFACWVLFTLAVHALPFFLAVSAGMLAYQTGAGGPGAIIVAFVAGAVALVLGQTVFAAVRSPVLRGAIGVLYAAPAAFAGYHAVHGLVAIGGPAAAWHELLSVAGAFVIGFVAYGRVAALAGAGPGGSLRGQSAVPRSARASNIG